MDKKALILLLLLAIIPGFQIFEPAAAQDERRVYLPFTPVGHPWENPFGVELDVSFGNNPIMQAHIQSLEVGWVRLNNRVRWRELQPTEGGPVAWEQLEALEAELRFLNENGIKPILIVRDYPYWATVGPTSCGRIASAKLPAFAAFVEQLVRRYSAGEFGVHHWELGNEPDVDPRDVPAGFPIGCWGDVQDREYFGGRQYGEMLKVVTPAIRRVDPNATVWIGGLLLAVPNTTTAGNGKPENFFKGILAAGAGLYFDIVAYHWYPTYYQVRADYDNANGWVWDPWGGGVAGKAAYLRNIMKQYGVEKPVFLNETALVCPNDWSALPWCQNPDQQFSQAQADFLVRSFVRGIGAGVEGFSWYSLEGPGWRSSGLLDNNGTPKPGYQAYRQLIRMIKYSTYRGPALLGAGLEAYTFQRNDTLIQIVWAIQDTTIQVSIPAAPFVDVRSLEGNPVPYSANGGNITFPVGFSPVYLLRNKGTQP